MAHPPELAPQLDGDRAHPPSAFTSPSRRHPPRHATTSPAKPSPLLRAYRLVSTLLTIAFLPLSVVLIIYLVKLVTPSYWQQDSFPNRVHFPSSSFSLPRHHLLHSSPNLEPTFLVFYSSFCPHCKQMRTPFLKLSNHFPAATFVAIDMEHPTDIDRELAKKFSVTHVPTLFFATVGEQQSNGQAGQMVTVKYKGKAEYAPISEFMTDQMDQLRKAGHGGDFLLRRIRQRVLHRDEQDKEL